MNRTTYDRDKRFQVEQFKVGDAVKVTPHTYGGSVPRVIEDKVAKITKTTLTTENGRVFNVSRGQWTPGRVGDERGQQYYSAKIWPAGDPDLAAWVEAMQERQRKNDIEQEARRALRDCTDSGYGTLNAEKVEAAIAAAQAWLEDTKEERAESRAMLERFRAEQAEREANR